MIIMMMKMMMVMMMFYQGTARPTHISKTFEPMEDDTALSAAPLIIMIMLAITTIMTTNLFATMIADNISGTDVPMARNVRPYSIIISISSIISIISIRITIKTEGIVAVAPTFSIHWTRK